MAAAGNGLVGGQLRCAQKRLHGIRGDDAELAEGGFVNFSGAGHSRRVRHRRDRTALGFADFEHDDGLLKLVRTTCKLEKPRAVLKSFHEDRYDFGGLVSWEEFHSVSSVHIR